MTWDMTEDEKNIQNYCEYYYSVPAKNIYFH